MIDFRYHIVSIVAIFLALAVGIALGAGPLKDPVDVALGNQTEALREERNELRVQVDDLEARQAYDDAWAAATQEPLTADRLVGERVVVVVMPGVDAETAATLTGAVEGAGGEVSGTVTLTEEWLDPENESVLEEVAANADGEGSSEGSAYERAGSALARALVAEDVIDVNEVSEPSQALLAAFVDAGLVETSGSPERRAGIALTVSPAPSDDAGVDLEAERGALLPLVESLSERGGEVLGGFEGSAEEGGLVRAVRDSEELRSAISTVDVVDTASGRISTVVALDLVSDDEFGQYGTGPEADAPAPPFES